MRFILRSLLILCFLASPLQAQCPPGTDFTMARVPAAACPNGVIRNAEVVPVPGNTATPLSYSWTITNGSIVNNYGRNVDLQIDGTAPAVLSVTVDYGSGCTVSHSATINVASPITSATASATTPANICQGQSVTLTASAAGGSGHYFFDWYSYGAPAGLQGQTITVTPSSNIYYYAVVTDDGGCGSASSNAVVINVTNIDATITANDNVCPNVVSSASAPFVQGNGYNWSIDGGGAIDYSQGSSSIGFHPGPNGSNLSVTVTNGTCSRTSSKFVSALPVPATPTITSSGPATFCQGGGITLTSSPASLYQWSSGETTRSIFVTTAGSFSVTTSNANGCSATSAPFLTSVNPLPSATITASGPVTFCQGGSVTLSAPAGMSSYSWSNGATTPSISVATSGSYSVTVTNANGCSATSAATTVTVNAPPAASITAGGPTNFCAGGSVTLSATAGMSSYSWSNGATTQSINVSTSGNYSVTVTNASGCSATSAATAVTVDQPPVITSQPASVTIRKNTATTLSVAASSPRPLSYQWFKGPSGNTSAPVAGATAASFTTPALKVTTQYWVRVMSSCGSVNSATATVTVQ